MPSVENGEIGVYAGSPTNFVVEPLDAFGADIVTAPLNVRTALTALAPHYSGTLTYNKTLFMKIIGTTYAGGLKLEGSFDGTNWINTIDSANVNAGNMKTAAVYVTKLLADYFYLRVTANTGDDEASSLVCALVL